jgi:hypothetical protein
MSFTLLVPTGDSQPIVLREFSDLSEDNAGDDRTGGDSGGRVAKAGARQAGTEVAQSA